MSAGIKRLFDELHLPRHEQEVLVGKYNITDLKELESKRQCLELNKLDGVRERKQTTLASAAKYIESKGWKTDSDLRKKFSGDKFFDHLAHGDVGASTGSRLTANYCHRFLGPLLHDKAGMPDELSQLAPSDHTKLITMIQETVNDKYLSPGLRQMPWCDTFLDKFVSSMLQPEPEAKPYVVFGNTQGGKTGMKSVVSAVCAAMQTILVIITKGVPESRELNDKLKNFADQCQDENMVERILSVSAPKGRRTTKERLATEARKHFRNGMVLVAADTGSQIKKVRELLETLWETEAPEGIRRKFVLLVDEADAMYRTKDERQIVEKQFHLLMAMKPQMTIMVTATPVPLYLILNQEKKVGFEPLKIDTHHDYLGLTDFEAFKDSSGEDQFLDSNEVKHNKGSIPYTNQQMMGMYDDAVSHQNPTAEGILLIDITNPRVYAVNNIFVKAKKVQAKFEQQDKPIAVVVVVGKGIHIRLPGDRVWNLQDKVHKLSDVLNKVEDKLHDFAVPIFVFGFSKMTRGVSCRSDRRVPTHMILSLGFGHSIDKMIQAMGRATFIGRSTLVKNLGEGATVKILTNPSDFETVQAHQKFILEIQARFDAGESLQDAEAVALKNIPKEFDYKSYTRRRIGQRERGAFDDHYKKNFEFNNRSLYRKLTSAEKAIAVRLQGDIWVHRVIRVLVDLEINEPNVLQHIDSILEAFNETYENWDIHEEKYNRITLAELKKTLTKIMKAEGPIRKVTDAVEIRKVTNSKRPFRRIDHWRVENLAFLEKIMDDRIAHGTNNDSDDEDFDPGSVATARKPSPTETDEKSEERPGLHRKQALHGLESGLSGNDDSACFYDCTRA